MTRHVLALVLILFSYASIADDGSERDMWAFFVKIAEHKSESKDVDGAIALYDLLLRKRISGPSDFAITYICESLVGTIDPKYLDSMPSSYWRCPKESIKSWVSKRKEFIVDLPRIKWCKKYPEWPWWAQFRKLEGRVTLSFDITVEGKTENVKAINSTRSIFEKPAIESMKTCQFWPKREYGIPVKEIGYEFTFTFEQE